jgi:hypothetical protein
VDEALFGRVAPLVRVRAECVALRLGEVLRQRRGAIAVVVRDARGHRRHRDPVGLRQADHTTPRGLDRIELLANRLVHEEVRQVGTALVGGADHVEHPRADDAATFPDPRHLFE